MKKCRFNFADSLLCFSKAFSHKPHKGEFDGHFRQHLNENLNNRCNIFY